MYYVNSFIHSFIHQAHVFTWTYCSISSSEEAKRLYLVRKNKNYLLKTILCQQLCKEPSHLHISIQVKWSVLRDVSDLPEVTHVQAVGLLEDFSFLLLWTHNCQLWAMVPSALKFTPPPRLERLPESDTESRPTPSVPLLLSGNHVIYLLLLPYHTLKPPPKLAFTTNPDISSFRIFSQLL